MCLDLDVATLFNNISIAVINISVMTICCIKKYDLKKIITNQILTITMIIRMRHWNMKKKKTKKILKMPFTRVDFLVKYQ